MQVSNILFYVPFLFIRKQALVAIFFIAFFPCISLGQNETEFSPKIEVEKLICQKGEVKKFANSLDSYLEKMKTYFNNRLSKLKEEYEKKYKDDLGEHALNTFTSSQFFGHEPFVAYVIPSIIEERFIGRGEAEICWSNFYSFLEKIKQEKFSAKDTRTLLESWQKCVPKDKNITWFVDKLKSCLNLVAPESP